MMNNNHSITPEKAAPLGGNGGPSLLNINKVGTGSRGYAAAANMMVMPMGDAGNTMNQLEMSLESSFFDGSSFIEDGPVGGKACLMNNNQNLEELLQAEEIVDPDAFLIKPG